MFILNSIIFLLMNYTDFGYSIGQSLKRRVLIRQRNICGYCQSKFSKFIPHEIHHLPLPEKELVGGCKLDSKKYGLIRDEL